jgi:hypothetical protein
MRQDGSGIDGYSSVFCSEMSASQKFGAAQVLNPFHHLPTSLRDYTDSAQFSPLPSLKPLTAQSEPKSER